MSFETQEFFCYSLIGREPENFTESVFPAFVSYVFAPEFFFFSRATADWCRKYKRNFLMTLKAFAVLFEQTVIILLLNE